MTGLSPLEAGLVFGVLPSDSEALRTMRTVRRMADIGSPITEVRNAMLKSSVSDAITLSMLSGVRLLFDSCPIPRLIPRRVNVSASVAMPLQACSPACYQFCRPGSGAT